MVARGSRRIALRTRFLVLLGVVTLPALGMIVLTAADQRRAARLAVEANALRVARLASREHAREISGGRELLTSLARIPGATEDESGQCPAYFSPLLRGFPHLANLGVLTADGRVACSVVPLPHPVDMSSTPAFQRAITSRAVESGNYQIGLIVRRPVLVLAHAVRSPDGAVSRVLFAALELGWFGQLAEQAELPRETVLSLADRQGRFLARSLDPDRWVGSERPEVASLFAQPATERDVKNAIDVDGVSRLVAVAPLANIEGVFVTVGVPTGLAFAAADQALWQQIVGLVALTLFAGAVGLLGTEIFVLRGIRALVQATRQLERGDAGARAPDRLPQGEIADLALAFNSMAEALERRQLEAEDHALQLQASERQLRALSQGLQAAREEERGRIARELHDQLGQSLTALKLDMAAWIRAAAAGPPDAAGVRELVGRVDELIQLVRDISTALRPGILDQLGLPAALEWQLAEFERQNGIASTLELRGTVERLDPTVSTATFRVFQEALTNVARHAKASEVHALLEGSAHHLVLEVSDDGEGLPRGAADSPSSLGLLGMRERAHLIGGTLILTSAPSHGTKVRLEVPLVDEMGGEPC